VLIREYAGNRCAGRFSRIIPNDPIDFLAGLLENAVFNFGNVPSLQMVLDKPVHLKHNAVALGVSFQRVVMLNVPRVSDFTILASVLDYAKDFWRNQFIPAAGCWFDREEILVVNVSLRLVLLNLNFDWVELNVQSIVQVEFKIKLAVL
jgi:hypothetical protein